MLPGIPLGQVQGGGDGCHETAAFQWKEEYGGKNHQYPDQYFKFFFKIHGKHTLKEQQHNIIDPDSNKYHGH